jgi:XTP/dITP diphosphohydrolase
VRLLIATRNPGKFRELEAILGGLRLELATDPCLPEVAETGATFGENAALKARAAADHGGCWALADDSGLEVDALNGEPGVGSARYGAPAVNSDAGRNALLLERLRGVPEERRTARFRAAVAIAAPDGRVWAREGACEGVIGFEPRGQGGFGYDPLFYLPHLGKTMAELDPAAKNRISHRARALAAAREVLEVAAGNG